jgi:carbamoyltransferase
MIQTALGGKFISNCILGISAFYHDSAACIVVDGEIIAAAQEERFTRKKHDHRFPVNAVNYCVQEAGISVEEIGSVAFYDKPFLKFERLLETYLSYAPSGLASFLKAMPLWLKEKLWMEDRIRKLLKGYEGAVYFPEHHQSHAASAFFPSPFNDASIITMDGVGEWTTTAWGTGHGNRIELCKEIHFPHSLGLLYTAFTSYTGFRVNSGEYKVMGLAPYGEPRFVNTILDNVMDLKQDGSFRLDMKYFNYCQGLTMTSGKFHELFGGPPRKPESSLTQRDMDLAASVQAVAEEVILRTGRYVRKQTGEKKLVLAGGVALNCVANGKLLRERVFEDIWIQPAAGDAGGALGAALFTWHQILDGDREVDEVNDLQKGSYLGPSWEDREIKEYLEDSSIPYTEMNEDSLIESVVDSIEKGKVVGLFNGRMEFGPRALGNRSIVGDPRSTEMQSIMNLKIKNRESFRPFAPSVLLEDTEEYFDLPAASPYMLLVAQVHRKRCKPMTGKQQKLFGIEKINVPRSDIPAVTHIDYSARVQTVNGRHNPRYYRLIKSFKEKTGYSVLINTSFNVRGEPIVCSPEDAYLCFMRTEMDVLVLGNMLLNKQSQPPLVEDRNWREIYELD